MKASTALPTIIIHWLYCSIFYSFPWTANERNNYELFTTFLDSQRDFLNEIVHWRISSSNLALFYVRSKLSRNDRKGVSIKGHFANKCCLKRGSTSTLVTSPPISACIIGTRDSMMALQKNMPPLKTNLQGTQGPVKINET